MAQRGVAVSGGREKRGEQRREGVGRGQRLHESVVLCALGRPGSLAAGSLAGSLAGWLTPRRRPSSFFPCPGHPRTAFLLACPSLSLPDGPCPPAVLRAPSSPPLHSYPAVPAVHPSLACSSSFQVRSVRRAALPPYAPTLAHPRPLPSLSSLPSRSHFSTPPSLARSPVCSPVLPHPFLPQPSLFFLSFSPVARFARAPLLRPQLSFFLAPRATVPSCLLVEEARLGQLESQKVRPAQAAPSTTASAHTTALDDRSAVAPSFNAVGWLTDARWRSFLASSCG